MKWQLDELKGDLKVDFLPKLSESIKKKDRRLVIVRWANLVYLALKQKFFWNEKEELKDFTKAKARLAAARYYYDIALAGNVRRYDKKRKSQIHKEILKLFEQLRSQIGRPAVLGNSSVAADPKGFKKNSAALVKKLDTVFPYFKVAKKGQGKR